MRLANDRASFTPVHSQIRAIGPRDLHLAKGRGQGKHEIACHRFITSLRTTPEGLLRLIRQRWSIENEWHWVRDTQLGEDAHRYANRTGVPLCQES